jgi:hypothetical protein
VKTPLGFAAAAIVAFRRFGWHIQKAIGCDSPAVFATGLFAIRVPKTTLLALSEISPGTIADVDSFLARNFCGRCFRPMDNGKVADWVAKRRIYVLMRLL